MRVLFVITAVLQAERVEGASSSEEEDSLDAGTSGSDGETAEGEREARREARAERRRKAADARTRRAAASILDGGSPCFGSGMLNDPVSSRILLCVLHKLLFC